VYNTFDDDVGRDILSAEGGRDGCCDGDRDVRTG
jgi:hypothetical protein